MPSTHLPPADRVRSHGTFCSSVPLVQRRAADRLPGHPSLVQSPDERTTVPLCDPRWRAVRDHCFHVAVHGGLRGGRRLAGSQGPSARASRFCLTTPCLQQSGRERIIPDASAVVPCAGCGALANTRYTSGGCHPARIQFLRTVTASVLFNRKILMVVRPHDVNPTTSVPSVPQE